MTNEAHSAIQHLVDNWLDLAAGEKPMGRHYLFRRSINLTRIPETAWLSLTAASIYRIYVNGELVMQGPARGTVHYAYVDTIDLTPWLRAGENTFAMEVVFYPNNVPIVLQHEFPPCDPGVGICLPLEDGRLVTLDEQWRQTTVDAYERNTSWARGQLAEHLYVDRYPDGWMEPGFDDTGWDAVDVGARRPPAFELRPRPTPLPVLDRREPVKVADVGFLEFPARYAREAIETRKLDWFGRQRGPGGMEPLVERVLSPGELDHVQYRRVCEAVSGGPWATNASALLHPGGHGLVLRGTGRIGGYAVYDLGEMMAGMGFIEATIPKGVRLDVSLMEWLATDSGGPDDGHERVCNVMVGYGGMTLVGDGGRVRFTGIQTHTFRYLCVAARGLSENQEVIVHRLGGIELCALRPSDLAADAICSDPMLNKVIEATKKTTLLMAQDFCASGASAERIITAGDCLQVSEAGRLFYGETGRALSLATFDLFIDQDVGDGGNWPNLPRGRAGGVTKHEGENMNWMLAPCMMVIDMLGCARERHETLPEPHRRTALGMAADAKNNLTPEGLIPSDGSMSNWSDWSKMVVGVLKDDYQGVCVSTNAYYYRMFAELAAMFPEEEVYAELVQKIGDGLRALSAASLASEYQRVTRFVPDMFMRQEDGSLAPFEAKEANVFGGATVLLSEVTQYWLLWCGALTPAQQERLWDVLRGWRSFEIPARDNTRTTAPSRASSVLGLYPRFHYLYERADPTLYRDARDAFGPNMMWDNSFWESLEVDSRSTLHPAPAYAGILLYHALTGIQPGPDARSVVIAPIVDDSLEWARGYKQVDAGVIGVSWRRGESRFTLSVGLPHGFSAQVILPEPVLGRLVRNHRDVPQGGRVDITGSARITVDHSCGLAVEPIGTREEV